MPDLLSGEHRRKVAIIQSNYIPWVGYFAAMTSVDVFVVYECVQYTKNDWRNRNQIHTRDGRQIWLSIPVRHHSIHQQFIDTRVAGHGWADSHFNTLRHRFARSKGWLHRRDEVQTLYEKAQSLDHLFQINRLFLEWVKKTVGIRSKIVFLDYYPQFPDPTERLISILQNFGATHYVSGPAAKSYIDPIRFQDAHIGLEYIDYDQLISKVLVGRFPVKPASILQLILENHHEFRCD